MKVKRALVSVSDKRDLEPFVRGLVELGVEVISTGGTARHLREAGLPITGISEVTGFPEIMDGRVKTLHPAIHGGILADRDRPSHMKAIAELGIKPIDLVVVNLYPFEEVTAQRGVSEADAIENIDIGGPCMVRAAAKNFAGVGIVTDPADYDPVLAELKENAGDLSRETRRHLAAKAFHHTAHYDSAIATWFGEQEEDFPANLMLDLVKLKDLRYGENPHQRAAWYSEVRPTGELAAALEQHHGQQLSFNNLLDLDSARRVLDEFALPCCVIVKHNNPCGVAVAESGGRRLREGLLLRSGVGLRRRDRGQPDGRRGPGPAALHQLRGGAVGSGLRGRGAWRSSRSRRTSASSPASTTATPAAAST